MGARVSGSGRGSNGLALSTHTFTHILPKIFRPRIGESMNLKSLQDLDSVSAKIRISEDELFDEWRIVSPKMVRDGAVSPEAYAASDLKVMLILKEVNDPGGGGWDLRNVLREGKRAQTWTNVARWMRGIHAMPEDLPWRELEPITTEDRRELLSSIAVINLKKEPGGHTSIGGEIAAAAGERGTLLRQQFSIYDPDLVIFCGTAGAGTSVLFPDVGPKWKKTSRGVSYASFGDGKTMISFSHPEARCPSPFIVYGLLDAVREIFEPSSSDNS